MLVDFSAAQGLLPTRALEEQPHRAGGRPQGEQGLKRSAFTELVCGHLLCNAKDPGCPVKGALLAWGGLLLKMWKFNCKFKGDPVSKSSLLSKPFLKKITPTKCRVISGLIWQKNNSFAWPTLSSRCGAPGKAVCQRRPSGAGGAAPQAGALPGVGGPAARAEPAPAPGPRVLQPRGAPCGQPGSGRGLAFLPVCAHRPLPAARRRHTAGAGPSFLRKLN